MWMLPGAMAALVAAALAGCGSDDGSADPEGPAAAAGGSAMEALQPVPCPEDLPDFSLGLQAEGDDGLYVAEIIDASPSPPEKYQNDWVVEFQDTGGNPLEDAELIEAEPFMPAHGHNGGFPPAISAMDEPGQFEVGKLNLWMGGPWEVRFTVGGEAGQDYIVFDVCIEE